MKAQLSFLIKVIRNAIILSGLYFVSVWAVGDLTWNVCKPVIVFMGTYIFTELARFYKLDTNIRNKPLMTFVY